MGKCINSQREGDNAGKAERGLEEQCSTKKREGCVEEQMDKKDTRHEEGVGEGRKHVMVVRGKEDV